MEKELFDLLTSSKWCNQRFIVNLLIVNCAERVYPLENEDIFTSQLRAIGRVQLHSLLLLEEAAQQKILKEEADTLKVYGESQC